MFNFQKKKKDETYEPKSSHNAGYYKPYSTAEQLQKLKGLCNFCQIQSSSIPAQLDWV